tara:strand:+ start:166 stop:810 length:645 start_codon:yes stop_codon:yes gene_type:complete
MARILVIGGHGKVALLLTPILAERGDAVSAVIRNPEHAREVEARGATPVVCDVESADVDELAALAQGLDAVVWSAGAGGGNADRTYAVDRDAAIRMMDAALAAGAARFVMVSYFGAGADHGVPDDNPFFAYAEAKSIADQFLRASALDWTILAPSSLTLDEPTGEIDAEAESAGSVSRGDVAAVIAQTLVEPRTIHRTIRFNTGRTPVAEALQA